MFILFRGIFLFIMYTFLYAWNVYGIYFYLYGLGWNKSNINYKLIFKFNRHYSKLDDILRRGCILSFIFFLNLLIFTVLQTNKDNKMDQFIMRYFDDRYCPLFIWCCYFGYILFPSYNVFNGLGRKYLFKVLLSILVSPFYNLEFRTIFAID